MDSKELLALIVEAIEAPARGSVRVNALTKIKNELAESENEEAPEGDKDNG
jgi:hypothetical protein